jgi:hypothetical protein
LHQRNLVLTLWLLIILIFSLHLNVNSWAEPSPKAGRSITLPIKVVLVGFNQDQIIPSDLITGTTGALLPDSIPQLDFNSGNNTGDVFKPNYQFYLAPSSFKGELEGYLNSIAQTNTGDDPWFFQTVKDTQNPEYYDQKPVAVTYVAYDANMVENWLWNNSASFGGTLSVGWTIIISYLPDLPSVSFQDVHDFLNTNGKTTLSTMPHYYGINVTSPDLGYQYRYRDFMNAWGGHHRMWFVDLSAGPVFNSRWEDLPLQVSLGDNNIDLSSDFGHHWLTDYIGDYVTQATYNFIAQSFVYYPYYARNYQIDVHILDDRNQSDRTAVPIQSTVNKELIQSAFRDLIPYSHIAVNITFSNVPSNVDSLIKSNYKYTDSWVQGAVFASPQRYGAINVKPIYNYMLDHLTQYEQTPFLKDDTMTIPVFAFAFSNQTYFTDTYKSNIGQVGQIDYENDALLGEALPSCVMISYNQWEFLRGNWITPQQSDKGIGFTQTIIHETGHEFGLMHPHQYGDIGDFIASPMGYFSDDYAFSQIDKDTVQRAHVDQLYSITETLLTRANSTMQNLVNQSNADLARANGAYEQMNYTGAIHFALNAYQLARQAAGNPALYVATSTTQTHVQFVTLSQTQTVQVSTTQLTQATSTVTEPVLSHRLIGVVLLSLFIGALVIILLGKRKAGMKRPADMGAPGRYQSGNAAFPIVFCTSCGARLPSRAKFCGECGARRT